MSKPLRDVLYKPKPIRRRKSSARKVLDYIFAGLMVGTVVLAFFYNEWIAGWIYAAGQ